MSRREVKIEVWKYTRPILIGLGAVLQKKLDNQDRALRPLLLEEYGVSKKWVIIMDKRQDKTAAWIQAETSGSSAQDRYSARGSGGGAKKRCGNGDE